MCQHHSSSQHSHGSHSGGHHHHADHSGCAHPHEHDQSSAGGPTRSTQDKLIVRLEHFVRHNREHGDFLEKLISDAADIGGEPVAQEIRAAVTCAARQSEHLQKAVDLLKTR
jgi:hypothetical protein